MTTHTITLIEKAARIALREHAGQKRKDGSPYVIHPFMVALKLTQHNFPETVIAAALVHDVMEDTTFPEAELRRELGDEVVNIVKAVTNEKNEDWEAKKSKYVETVRNGPVGAKAVCAADKIHNLESLLATHAEQGPELWKTFTGTRAQKQWFESKVLTMLKETWSHPLLTEYERLLEKEKSLS